MDPNTNELVTAERLNELKDDARNDFLQLPPELNHAAKRKLNGRNSAFISKASGGKLSKWAAQQRKKKRKAQKQARRRNR